MTTKQFIEFRILSPLKIGAIRFWYNINPFQEIAFKVYYNFDAVDNFIEFDDKLRDIFGRYSDASGTGCGTRDHEWYIKRYQLNKYKKALVQLSESNPEAELSQLNEIDDFDYLGVGY